MDISLIIPAYNEEKRIGSTLSKIEKYLNSREFIENWEIIVIDDGSKDSTRNIVEEHIKENNKIKLNEKRENRGKGFSVREGALLAKYSIILFSDADLSTPIEELNKFSKFINDYNVIIGSRALRESNVEKHQPFYREFIGKTFNLLVRTLTGLNIKDTQCGFKLFNNCKFLFEQQKLEGFSFDVELLYLANKNGLKILELPVTWVNDERSKVSPVKDSIKMLKDLVKIKALHKKLISQDNKQ